MNEDRSNSRSRSTDPVWHDLVALIGAVLAGVLAALGAGLAALGAVAVPIAVSAWRLGRRHRVGRASSSASVAIDWSPLLDRLDRLVAAVEARPAGVEDVRPRPRVDLDEVATAIDEGRWREAEALLASRSDHPDAAAMGDRLRAGRDDARTRLMAELAAARDVNDPDRVLAIRDGLADLADGPGLAEVDADLAKWGLGLITKRLRAGTVRPDVAELATRIADRFPATTEGASLRASLPTLRRSAGLCPRCARPYRGISEACPVCLAPPPLPEPTPEPDPPDAPTSDREGPFLTDLDPLD